MSRRSLLALALAALLFPGSVLAADGPIPSPSPEPTLATEADASPRASLEPVQALPDVIEPSLELDPLLPEPDFVVGDWELQVVPWNELRLNGGRAHAIRTVGPQDGDGVPMRPFGPGGKLVYNPTVIAQQGMKHLDGFVQSGNRVHLRYARKYARILDELATGGPLRRWQPHDYDRGVHAPGWVNSNSHGLVLSFLSRFHEVTDTPVVEAAGRMLAAYERRPQNKRWISLVTDDGYLWFEHWPEGLHDHTLNAHINALFGLYDYWRITDSPLAEQYFRGGAKTVRDELHRFRRKGNLSRYSLGVAQSTLHYHETHIEQLRILAKMTGDDWFARQAELFERDEDKWRAQNRGGGD